jgi:polysaccharide biosynthesis protein VpsM
VLVRRDVFNASGNAEVEVSQLTTVGAGVSFANENYKRRGYTDSDSLQIPLNVYYRWTPKVDLSLGYRYRDYQVDIGQDSKDHFLNVGARGDFTPKLVGRFAVGYNQRKLERGGDDSQLGVDASFTYEISPKTSLELGASNDFGTSPQGQQQKNLTFHGFVTSRLSAEWSVNAGLSYRGINYGTRTDDYVEAMLGTTYVVNANVRIQGAYVNRNYSSAIRSAEFKNNVFSVAANFRY